MKCFLLLFLIFSANIAISQKKNWTKQQILFIEEIGLHQDDHRGIILNESTEGDYDGRPWDGNYNGTPLHVASYYYVIEYNDSTTQNTQGNV